MTDTFDENYVLVEYQEHLIGDNQEEKQKNINIYKALIDLKAIDEAKYFSSKNNLVLSDYEEKVSGRCSNTECPNQQDESYHIKELDLYYCDSCRDATIEKYEQYGNDDRNKCCAKILNKKNIYRKCNNLVMHKRCSSDSFKNSKYCIVHTCQLDKCFHHVMNGQMWCSYH